MKICVDNDNFESSIASLKSKTFFNEGIIYRFLFDKLKPKYKTYMLENDLDKNRIVIYLTPGDKKNKEIAKKYKHQVVLLKTQKLDLRETLNKVFRGKENREQLISDLATFQSRHILMWLDTTAATSSIVALKMCELDKYVYSSLFKHLVVQNLYGCGATAQWRPK